jgi:hypothetical protein
MKLQKKRLLLKKMAPLQEVRPDGFTLGNWILLFGKTKRFYKTISKKSVQNICPAV